MGKPVLLFIGPLETQSGYGQHAADLARCFINMNKFDVKIQSLRWGDCPMNALDPVKDIDLISRILPSPNMNRQPEVCVWVSIPSEFTPYGKYNIGITAGIETTICPAEWIEGLNRMNLNIVPSNHAKDVFLKSEFIKNDQKTKIPIGHIKVTSPIEVIFEGADISKYRRLEPDQIHGDIVDELNLIKEDFVYLFVGHWLQGSLGNDRKDVGMMIKTFIESFSSEKIMPALLLKTSGATFSAIDREEILKKLREIVSLYKGKQVPNIYFLHGQLTDDEMNLMYNHPKIKSMVTLTKGEGFGRPLLEFTMVGKPIIASAWSGHIDFLDKEMSLLLPGELTLVDKSAVNQFIIDGSRWFTADYKVSQLAFKKSYHEYNKVLSSSKKLMYQNKNKFSLKDMEIKLNNLLTKYLPYFPEEIILQLPKKELSLPKLIKI
jgi:hypothetical protein